MKLQNLQRVTSRVWVHPASPHPADVQSTVGIVVGTDETLLIDAGNSPRLGNHIRQQLEVIGAPPVGRVVYTHHHWDHTFGACAYRAPALAHRACRAELLELAQKPWGQAYLEQAVLRDPARAFRYEAMGRSIKAWDEFEIVVPQALDTEQSPLHVGEVALEVRYVGGAHAADSVVVGVPAEGVLFLGDCFYPPPLDLRRAGDTDDLAMLAALITPEYRFYVSGHDSVATFDELRMFVATANDAN